MAWARRCLPIVLLASAAAGQTTAPAPRTDQAALGAAEINEKMIALIGELPMTVIKAPPLTPRQREVSEKAREFYKAATRQIDRLDRQTRFKLTLIGIRAGFGAGDAEVMLSAARRRWQIEQAGDGVTDYSAYVLGWAGIFAGEAKAARRGLQHLARRSSQPGLKSLARGMGAIAARAGKPVKVSVRLLDGKAVNLPHPAGKVVVLNFWSSHSVAAVREIPALKTFYDKHRQDKNFMMVGVSLDRKVADARRRMATHGMTWAQAMDGGLRSRFAGRGVPHVAVVSAKGHIFWQGHPGSMETLVRTTDFALRQAERLSRHKPAATRPRQPEKPAARKPPAKPAADRPTPVQEAAAENKFKMARMYLKMRMRRKGKAVLQEIVRQYPGTRAAAKARQRLRYLH